MAGKAEIVDAIVANGVRISQPTVSRRMALLEEEGLIEKVGVDPRGVIWGKKAVLETALRLSRYLETGPMENAV